MSEQTTNDTIRDMAEELIRNARELKNVSAEGYAMKAKRLAEGAQNDQDRQIARAFIAVARSKLVGRVTKYRGHYPGGIGFALAALCFLTLSTSAQPIAPDGCTLAGTTGEGFPVAVCQDGSTTYRDDDGQPYQNDAGYPVYPPGTWVEMSPNSPVFG